MLRGLSVGLCILSDGHIGEPCKTAEPIEVPFVGVGQDKRATYGRRSLVKRLNDQYAAAMRPYAKFTLTAWGQTLAAQGAMVKSPAGRLDTLNGRRCGHSPNYYDYLLWL